MARGKIATQKTKQNYEGFHERRCPTTTRILALVDASLQQTLANEDRLREEERRAR